MLYRFLKEHPNVDVTFREKSPVMQMALLSGGTGRAGFGEWPSN
jgi:hypothetical protein